MTMEPAPADGPPTWHDAVAPVGAGSTSDRSAAATAPPPGAWPGPAAMDGSRVHAPPSPAPQRFVFAATGAAYFRIWIVNLLLTIVTVGLYSPWAKVRRLRYFYGNTLFDGSSFEFHGRPFALLKGRLIGIVLLVMYSLAAKVSFAAWIAVAVVLLGLMPWLLWKSLRFRFANSSYRGIRFGFDGSLSQAYLTFVPLMLMVLAPAFASLATQAAMATSGGTGLRALGRYYLALGVGSLFAPWFYFRLRAYQHRHARLGTTLFAFDGRAGPAYLVALKLALLWAGFAILAMVPFFIAMFLGGRQAGIVRSLPLFVGGALGYVVLLSGLSQSMAMIQNFVWNHSTLGGARFASDVDRTRTWWILFVNLLLTLLTVGLYWPFAVVRLMRYRIGSLAWAGDSADIVAAGAGAALAATGEETAELFGLDLAL